MTFKEEIEQEAGDEPIEACVIGVKGWGGDFNSERIPGYHEQTKGVVKKWDEVKNQLDYAYYDGFGAPECNAIYAWTKSKVIFVEQYDGSTSVVSVPRHPIDCEPSMPGG
jgi:hypothetical protein